MFVYLLIFCFFFQAEDGIRDLVRSRGLGDVYKRQPVIMYDAASTGSMNFMQLALEFLKRNDDEKGGKLAVSN